MADFLSETLQRIHLNKMNILEADNDDSNVDSRGSNNPPPVSRVNPPAPPAPPPPKDNKKKSDSDDSDNDDSDDNGDDEKEFPTTPAIAPLCKKIEDLGDQFYVISELIKQVEGFKGENKSDAMNDALGALQGALTDMPDMQNTMKIDLAKYLRGYVDNG